MIDKVIENNRVSIIGEIVSEFKFSHEVFGEGFYTVDVSVVYKTLVVRGEKTGINVFVIPAAKELDLKRCAAATGDKRVEMIHVNELLPLTGYIRGGCSPVGMKKKYPTFIDSSAFSHERIYVSAGQRGVQLIISPEDLKNAVSAVVGDYVRG